jgi:hypothetical protein
MVFTPAMKDGVKVRQIYEHKSSLAVLISAGTGRRPSATRPGC